jgi:hypothetical protein
MSILMLPIMILNFFSGIVGGVWLAVLGYWHIILVAIGLIMGGSLLVSLLLMPSLLLLGPVAMSQRLTESKLVMIPLTLLSVGYTYCVMGVWAIGIFWYFSSNVDSAAALPTVLWSYSTATAVWNYMAQREAQAGNEYSGLSAVFNQFGCIALMVYVYSNFRHLDFYEMAVWFSVPMAISLVIQVIFMLSMMRRARY